VTYKNKDIKNPGVTNQAGGLSIGRSSVPVNAKYTQKALGPFAVTIKMIYITVV
jgi:hypothetical protein